jgi:hypothetical protein
MANPRGQQRDKPVRDALRIEAALLESGEETPAMPGSLRYSARQMLIRAGADTQAFREVADRLDGKPAQAIVGDSEQDPISVLQTIERRIVDPNNPDS